MNHFTKEQMWEARNADLYSFLRENYPDDFEIERDCLRPKNNHSISIRQRMQKGSIFVKQQWTLFPYTNCTE